jgi:tetratricopeptide (TPR) repeat protein
MKQLLVAGSILVMLVFAGCRQSVEARQKHAVERGKRLLTSKDFARAILEFKNATQLDPRNSEVQYLLGISYLGANDLASALGPLRRATELNPNYTEAQIKLSEILATVPDPSVLKDAAGRMQTVLATAPKNPDALRTLAYAEFGLGQLQEAEEHLSEAVENGPENLRSAVTLAQLRSSQKRTAEAEQILKRVADQKPQIATPFVVLGAFYAEAGRTAEARQAFSRALAIDNSNANALELMGKLQLKSGQAEEAAKTFHRVSELPDKRYKTFYAIFLLKSGKNDEAVREFERQAARSPLDRDIRKQLISAYLITGKVAEAEKIISEALSKNPSDTDALLHRSRVRLANKKYEEAATDLNDVVRFEPNSADAHYLLAHVHQMRGNSKSQQQELSEALRLNPSLLIARVELSRLLISANPKAALELLNETPESQKRNSEVIAQRNWALLSLGDKGAAAGVANALSMDKTADTFMQDAVIKLQRGDILAARTVLDEALKKYPEEVRALDLLSQTYLVQKQIPIATRRIKEHAATNSRSAVIQNFLGGWLQKTGDSSGARTAFEAAKSDAPGVSWPADLSLASLDISENKLDSARNRLLPLTSHPEARTRARLLLALVEEKTGDRSASFGQYRKVLSDQPDNIFALNNLAYGLAEYGNAPDEALRLATRAKELQPDNASIDDTLGWVYLRKGLYSNAVQYLERAVKREANANRHAHLAIAYAKQGDTQRSMEQLTAAINLNPNLPEIAVAQKLLSAR